MEKKRSILQFPQVGVDQSPDTKCSTRFCPRFHTSGSSERLWCWTSCPSVWTRPPVPEAECWSHLQMGMKEFKFTYGWKGTSYTIVWKLTNRKQKEKKWNHLNRRQSRLRHVTCLININRKKIARTLTVTRAHISIGLRLFSLRSRLKKTVSTQNGAAQSEGFTKKTRAKINHGD